jgi:hypothetical protein
VTASTTVGFILCSIRDFSSLASIWLLGKYPLFIFVFNKGFFQFGKYWVIRQVSVIFMSNSIRGGGANSKMCGQQVSPLG